MDTLERERFDVMLLDLTMPRMTGVEVVRWLRDRPDVAPALRIVVISACPEDMVPINGADMTPVELAFEVAQ